VPGLKSKISQEYIQIFLVSNVLRLLTVIKSDIHTMKGMLIITIIIAKLTIV
jgi:hypothetical protein